MLIEWTGLGISHVGLGSGGESKVSARHYRMLSSAVTPTKEKLNDQGNYNNYRYRSASIDGYLWMADKGEIMDKLREKMDIPKDMIAWILKRLNSKDASEFMLALSVGKPLDSDVQLEIEHTHQWIPGGIYKHTHKKGDIPHGHHGSKYVKLDRPDRETDLITAKREERERIIKGIRDIEFESDSATDFLNKTLYYIRHLKEKEC